MAGIADGSYDLGIFITDLQTTKTIRTRGDVHVGGLMLKLVQSIETETSKDWSDHAMWWPQNNTWLLRTRRTLDQYNVNAGTTLHFTPMHKNVKVILPDIQTRDMRLNFSVNVFNNVIAICKSLGIRHPEELSLARTDDRKPQKRLAGVHRPRSMSETTANTNFDNAVRRDPDTASADIVLGRSMDNLFDANESSLSSGSKTASLDSLTSNTSLVATPETQVRQALAILSRCHGYGDKAKINASWLDSSLSLMEQDISENATIMLRFKFCVFFNLNPRYDAVRINQIYEQARWSLICEQLSCGDEEMIFFAALQLHINQLQKNADAQTSIFSITNDVTNDETAANGDDEVDAALDSLQMSLGGGPEMQKPSITKCPELCGYHLFLKPKKFSLKRFKKQYFVLRETELKMFRVAEDVQQQKPLLALSLRGCDVRGEAAVKENKFVIHITTMSDGSSTEVCLRLDDMKEYAEWLAAIRLAARRKTMADVTYENEVQSLIGLLKIRQATDQQPEVVQADCNYQLENLVSATIIQKLGRRQLVKRINEARSNVQKMTVMDAKLAFINTWQSLPECGNAYFIVTFKGSSRRDLIAVGVQRLAHLDMTKGHCLKAWTYDTMTSWSVNWDIEQVKIELGDNEVAFNCQSAGCKTVHEFIGGYVFLAMRSLEKSQTLNEELFHKLTGGWI